MPPVLLPATFTVSVIAVIGHHLGVATIETSLHWLAVGFGVGLLMGQLGGGKSTDKKK